MQTHGYSIENSISFPYMGTCIENLNCGSVFCIFASHQDFDTKCQFFGSVKNMIKVNPESNLQNNVPYFVACTNYFFEGGGEQKNEKSN